ncbi:XylR N-terminal domain-containing protein [Oceanobacillus senegalensis]|uniref:XylR N-terminal domain-containing protein n=1 Tax=Oceanobacillus senegalensis TaxID=1936063 RepID=UPI001FE63584|nr:XylR N-terminal domain-containing protein [Oceanobacillus senegalensis]
MNKSLSPLDNIGFTEDGLIYSGNSRSVLTPTSSFGILRKDLYRNIGKERVKGFLMRYGTDLGRRDAKMVLEKFKNESVESIIKKGPIFHQIQGHVIATLNKIEVIEEENKISTYIEGIWKSSFEAEEHIHHFGKAEEPVCYMSVGYGNGYLSEICNQTVLFNEISCVGKGDKECRWVGRTIDYWTDEMSDELQYYKEQPVIKELELTYEKLLEERNNLKNVSIIYNKLTEEILKGKDLSAMMDIVHDYTGTAIIVEDQEFHQLASSGIPDEMLFKVNQLFKDYVQSVESSFHHTQTLQIDHHTRLVTPIYLQGRIIGYCSFIYENSKKEDTYNLRAIIERISSVCALYLLNKKTEAEAEERMKGRFLEQLLSEEYSKEEIIRRSGFIGLNLFQPFHIVVIQYKTYQKDYREEMSFLEEVMNQSSTYFKKKGMNILMGQLSNKLAFLFLDGEINKKDGILSTCEHYMNHLSELYPTVSFQAGLSMESDQIEKASESYSEALTAMRIATNTNKVVPFYSLGILGPLVNTNNKIEIEKIAMYTLHPLSSNLDHKNMELIRTLYEYLRNGGNLENTAESLALSLSGLRYRIAKIEDLLGKDLRNPEVTYNLLLSIQALISIGKLEF